jgi:DNA-binding NarL/FixJ family response regulator
VPQRANKSIKSISVVLAEDHGVLRDGLHCVLKNEPGISVVSMVGDGSSAIREVRRLSPRVVVMGISMPGMDGIEATRVIAQHGNGTRVLILSTQSSPQTAQRALQAGALGYLTKESSAQEVVIAVRAVADGRRYLSQEFAHNLLNVERGREGPRARTVETLTQTERNILRLVADGKSNSEVAQLIGLSRRTVETYRIRLMRKLGVSGLPSLVKYAIKNGLTTLD